MKTFCKAGKLTMSIMIGAMILFLAGCSGASGDSGSGASAGGDTQQSQIQGYPISSDVVTTRERTVAADPAPAPSGQIKITDVSKYREYGYGTWQYGKGTNSGKMLDIMPVSYSGASITNTVKLLRFFTITDIHITDKEGTAQLIYLGYSYGISSAYSGVMLYTTQVLDAAIQTINALHKTDSFDFGISLGDTCNSTQYNETRWYVDVIDGQVITPSSGAHAGADTIDYQKPYQAAGIDKTIKWYQTLGNHDHFWMGSNPVNDYLRPIYTGIYILNMGNVIADPLGVNSRGYYQGSIDGSTPYGNIIGAGPVGSFSTPPTVPAADPNRRSLTRNEWIKEFFTTSSSPVGHGFSQVNVDTGFACYTFEPKSNIPIKVIVLDDTQREDDANVNGYGHAYLDKERYDWLVSELDKGQAEGKLMIIAAHCPIGVGEPSSSPISWSSIAYVTEADLIAKLHTYSNLLLWIAGHRHLNNVTAQKSPDAAHPELGFWEAETSSLRDYPQQFRTFDIVRNSDKTISIIVTDVDTAVREGSPAAISRSYAVAAQQFFTNPAIVYLPSGSCNAELVKQLSPEMQKKLTKLKN